MINDNFFLNNLGISNAFDTKAEPRHRWYYYKEGFSPSLVNEAINVLGLGDNDLVIDPFNGSGTVTLTASSKKIKSIGFEVNPFTAFIAKTKLLSCNTSTFDYACNDLLFGRNKSKKSPLLKFSTFSEKGGKSKWLFNSSVLNSFEAGISKISKLDDYNTQALLKLALIGSAMDNCNARKDGKCLRYKNDWNHLGFGQTSFLETLEERLNIIRTDLKNTELETTAEIICDDSRKLLNYITEDNKFSLCITSPPYLNTFDYTDIYRPELFLGGFVKSMDELTQLRLKTLRSHVQVNWEKPQTSNFGTLYDLAISEIINRQDSLMHKNIPLMVQAYFEDMYNILCSLRSQAKDNAELWLVVSTSAYAGIEIPVDMILGEIGNKTGWYLKDIGVLRYLKKRKSKYSQDINKLRESVVILKATKF